MVFVVKKVSKGLYHVRHRYSGQLNKQFELNLIGRTRIHSSMEARRT